MRCKAIIRIADDKGENYVTFRCESENEHVDEHVVSAKHIFGVYSVAWDFDEQAEWEYEEIPLWGRHADGTPKTQDEWKVRETLEDQHNTNDRPDENQNTEEE